MCLARPGPAAAAGTDRSLPQTPPEAKAREGGAYQCRHSVSPPTEESLYSPRKSSAWNLTLRVKGKCLNPRTAGGLSHLRTDDRPPPQGTRKLRKIAASGKRRWIGRGKFYKKYLDHFLIRSCTGFFIMNVTFKLVIKRAKRIVCTLIVCSTGCKLFRIYAGSKSLTIRRVSFSYGSGMSAPSKRVIFFPFLDDDAVRRHWLLSSTAVYRVWHQFDESLESTFISEGLIFSYE